MVAYKYLDGKGFDEFTKNKVSGNSPPGQLFYLKTDPGEATNLYNKQPKVVKRLKAQLEQFKSGGRSAPLR